MPIRKTFVEKTLHRTSVALREPVQAMLEKQAKQRNCNSVSDYITGLIIYDHLLVNKSLDTSKLNEFPMWLVNGNLVKMEAGKASLV